MFLVSRWGWFFSFLIRLVEFSGAFGPLVVLVLCVFLGTRVPYVFGVGGFGLFLLGWVAPLFLTLFLSRLSRFGLSLFFSSFVPSGTPLWISPLVVLAESVSYVVRPVVLLLRPLLNLSIGAFGGVALGGASLLYPGALLLVFSLFFYEIFVAVVHWFIVSNILSFSKDH